MLLKSRLRALCENISWHRADPAQRLAWRRHRRAVARRAVGVAHRRLRRLLAGQSIQSVVRSDNVSNYRIIDLRQPVGFGVNVRRVRSVSVPRARAPVGASYP